MFAFVSAFPKSLHCTDEAQQAETVLSAVLSIVIIIIVIIVIIIIIIIIIVIIVIIIVIITIIRMKHHILSSTHSAPHSKQTVRLAMTG